MINLCTYGMEQMEFIIYSIISDWYIVNVY